ncbi:TonB-dependent receptor [Thalassotalea fonticola]|uniref:TonB-dependent receptor n=1 Tax=Thalassotalea fonticola TaxID=3065649 RepID=A0ABZ0GKH6_9GAMM|nr:TonB-dependent receptor [Colwelliaceae bacterium S1-1]
MQKDNMKKFKLTTVSQACLLAISVSAMPLLAAEEAQTAEKNNKEDAVEVITVTGVRGSIQQSMNDKRFSSEIMDGISAEDIGQLPDENIAEALQRVTGIQMTRDADGEGSTVQIRGISNNNVEINGQTSSGTGSDRSVNFQDLPSELFSGIEVLKASTADRIEGSLGGTINLKTRRPLGIQKDGVLSVTAKAKHSELAEETSPDFSVFGAKNWRDTALGDFGFLATVARKESHKRTEAFGGGDWDDAPGNWYRVDQSAGAKSPFKNTNYDTHRLDTAPIDVNKDGVIDANDNYYMVGGFRSYVKNTEVTRDSLNATLQWQPNDEMNFFIDTTITDGEQIDSGTQFNTAFTNAMPTMGFAQNFSSLGTSADGIQRHLYDAGTISGANIRMGGAPSEKELFSESEKFTIGGDIQITDDLNVSAEYSTSEGSSYTKQAQLNMGYDYDQNNQFNGNDWAGVTSFDLRGTDLGTYTSYDSPYGNGPLNEIMDPTSLEQSKLSYFQMQRNADDTEQDDESFKIDVTLDLDGDFFTGIKVGVRKAERSFGKISYINKSQKSTNSATDIDGNVVNTAVHIQSLSVDPAANGDDLFADSGMTQTEVAQQLQDDCFSTEGVKLDNFSGNVPQSWATTECGSDYYTDLFNLAPMRAIGANGIPMFETVGARFDVTEKTSAAYIRTDFYTEIFSGMTLFGNVGGRYIETETISSGYKDVGGTVDWATIRGEYDDFLPSLNLNIGLNEKMVLRFAAAKVMSRPGLAAISPSLKLTYQDDLEDGFVGTGQSGNPDLDPVRATNFDLSFEWYYSDSSMFSAALFYKDIESTIARQLPEDRTTIWIEKPNGDQEKWSVNSLENAEGTTLEGVELGLTHTFDSLPGLLSYTGVSANYTYTDEPSKIKDDEGDSIGRKGLSQDSANLVAFYDDKSLSVRLAYNWRSEYIKRQTVLLGWNAIPALPEYEDARGQLDLTVNYSFNKHLKLNFSAINLNDSVSERYLKYEDMNNYLSESGRRYNLGLVYRF